jgi:hypothetical protein
MKKFMAVSALSLAFSPHALAQSNVESPAMLRRDASAGSPYWLGTRDSDGAYLDGGKTYKLVVPLPLPAALYWSVKIYDPDNRSEIQTEQGKAALRSLFELKDARGSTVELYFGPMAPVGQESRWIKTTPGKGWFTYMRLDGPEQAAFDRTWKPGDIEPVPERRLVSERR